MSIFKCLNSSYQVLSSMREDSDSYECLGYSTFKMLQTFEDFYFHTSPQEKSRELMSGDRGGQAAGPPLPIQRSRNLSLRNADLKSPVWRRTVQLKMHMSSPSSLQGICKDFQHIQTVYLACGVFFKEEWAYQLSFHEINVWVLKAIQEMICRNTHVHEICNCLWTSWHILKSKPNMKMCHLQLWHTFEILEKY